MAVAAGLLLMVLSSVAAAGEPGVPEESWVYRELDRMRAAGLLQSGTSGFRPQSRTELARQLAESRRLFDERRDTFLAPQLQRLEEQFAVELAEREDGAPACYLRPIDELCLRYTFVDGEADVQNERGRDFHEGSNLRFSASSRGRWGPLSGYLRWEGRWLAEDDENPEATAGRVEEGYVRVSAGRMFAQLGRQSLWWGPGRHGSLIMSDNARPLDMLRVGTAEPLLLPGFLSRLGPVRFEGFLARLEKDRFVSRPWFAGARVGLTPWPWLELGASRVVIFGGGDRSITFRTVGDLISWQEKNSSNQPGNQLAAVDWRLTVPWRAQPFELYGELGGEDEGGGFISKKAVLAGVYLPRLGPWSLFDVRVEYADTYFGGHGGKDRIWYRHSQYRSGYTHHGRVMGHHAGTDAKDWYFELGVAPRKGLRLWAFADWEERELSFDDPEKRREFGAGVEWRIDEHWTVTAGWTREDVENLGAIEGDDEDGDRLDLVVRWKF